MKLSPILILLNLIIIPDQCLPQSNGDLLDLLLDNNEKMNETSFEEEQSLKMPHKKSSRKVSPTKKAKNSPATTFHRASPTPFVKRTSTTRKSETTAATTTRPALNKEIWSQEVISLRHNLEECSVTSREEKLALLDEMEVMKRSLLESLLCGRKNCSKVVVSAEGPAALVHPARLGVFELTELNDLYPAFRKESSGQSLFFQRDLNKWSYGLRIHRWIIGPKVGDAVGGIMIRTTERCPWRITAPGSESLYLDNLKKKWIPDELVSVACYDESVHLRYNCDCKRLNISTSSESFERKEHLFGTFVRVDGDLIPDDILAPVYKNEDSELDVFLYSHHPEGHLWLIGTSFVTWSLRLNLLQMDPSNKKANEFLCPTDRLRPKSSWEYLATKSAKGGQLWLKDITIVATCM